MPASYLLHAPLDLNAQPILWFWNEFNSWNSKHFPYFEISREWNFSITTLMLSRAVCALHRTLPRVLVASQYSRGNALTRSFRLRSNMHFENTADASGTASSPISANSESGSKASGSIPLVEEETKPEVSSLPEIGICLISACYK